MALNTLNRNKAGLAVIRFPMKGRITTTAMKVNCLIQATLGSLSIADHSLVADANKALRSASRVAKCLVAFVRTSVKGFALNVSAIQLCKCEFYSTSGLPSSSLPTFRVPHEKLLSDFRHRCTPVGEYGASGPPDQGNRSNYG